MNKHKLKTEHDAWEPVLRAEDEINQYTTGIPCYTTVLSLYVKGLWLSQCKRLPFKNVIL